MPAGKTNHTSMSNFLLPVMDAPPGKTKCQTFYSSDTVMNAPPGKTKCQTFYSSDAVMNAPA